MLPTRPRLAARSTSSSCRWPEESTATGVSCGLTLTRISSLTLNVHALVQLRGLVERQPHDAGEAAAQLGDELRRAPLDGVGAGLVVALAGRDIAADLLGREGLEGDLRPRDHGLELRLVLHDDRGPHLLALTPEL